MKTSNIIKTASALLLFLLNVTGVYAQLSTTYTFSSASGTYTELTGGTTVGTATTSSTTATTALVNVSYTVALPFTFNFNGTNYTTAYINSNGALHFTAANTTTTPVTGSGTYAAVAAFGRAIGGNHRFVGTRTSGSNVITAVANTIGINVGSVIIGTGIPTNAYVTAKTASTITLSANATSTGSSTAFTQMGDIKYETLGTTPNREFVVQYRGFGTASTQENNLLNFQIRLNENGNIQVVYGNIIQNTYYTNSAEVGLRSGVSTTAANKFWRTTYPGDNWAATLDGSGGYFYNDFGPGVAPSSGLTYNWNKQGCSMPNTLASSNIATTTASISWAGSGVTYSYEVRTSGAAGSGSTGLVASGTTTATSINLTSLTANTTYSFYVRASCTGSINSVWSSASTFTTLTPRTVGTITAMQQTGTTAPSTTNVNLYRIDIPTTGSIGTLTLNSVTIEATNTNNADVTGVSLWIGTSTAPSTQLGTTQTLSSGTATFSGLITSITAATTYLWVRYNVALTATDGNLLDLKLNAGSIVIAATGGAATPGTLPAVALDLAGNVEVNKYCIGAFGTSGCSYGDYINNFSINTLVNNGTGCSANAGAYTKYPAAGTTTTTLRAGQAYTVSLSSGNGTTYHRAAVWIDLNQDGDFQDAGEFVVFPSAITANSTATVSFPVPLTALAGNTRLRVKYVYSSSSTAGVLTQSSDCTTSSYGETEDYTVNIIVITSTTWTAGAGTNDWFTASNWSDGVPSATVSALIPNKATTANISPQIAYANATVKNLTIQAGGAVDISAVNSPRLDVYGNISNSGSTVLGQGKIALVTGSHTISGDCEVVNLEVDGATTVTGALKVWGTLALKAGVLNVSSGTLLLASSSTRTGMVDDYSTGYTGTLTGSVTVQRYVSNKAASFYFIGSPVSNASINDWGNDFSLAVMNNAVDGSQVIPTSSCSLTGLAYGSPYGGLFDYRENKVANCNLQGWHVRTGGTIPAGQGFAGRILDGTLVDLTGGLVTGAVTGPTVTRTVANGTASKGFNLIANPYPSPILWSYVAAANTNLQGTAYTYINAGTLAGTYQPINGITPAAALASSEAFFVEAIPASSTVQFTNGMRTTGTNNFLRTAPAYQQLLTLNITGNGFADQARVAFGANFTLGFDRDFDAHKMKSSNGQPNLFITEGAEEYAIYAQPSVAETQNVPLSFTAGTTGNYTISASDINGFDISTLITLEDKKLGIMHNLRTSGDYSFTADANDAEARFVIHFTANKTTGIAETPQKADAKVTAVANNIQVIFSNFEPAQPMALNIYDVTGRKVLEEQKMTSTGTQLIPTYDMVPGIYFITLSNTDFQQTTKVVVGMK